MKKIIMIICVIGFMIIPSVLSVNITYNTKISMVPTEDSYNTLITEFGANDSFSRVIEVDMDGNIVWQKKGLVAPHDAERLPNGNTLITEYGAGAVIEVDYYGNIVWNKTDLQMPMDAERLSNGNTLISEYNRGTVIEVNSSGNEVWIKSGLSRPFDAERLPNGNTLIAEVDLYPDGRIIEVDSAGNIVWSMTDLDAPVDIEMLVNESTGKITYLITEHVGKRVYEIDKEGTIIWQKTGLLMPDDAERLENGNTLIAEVGANRVIEVDQSGTIVWVMSGLKYPVDAERIPARSPPSIEIINPKEGYFHLRGKPLFSSFNRTIIYGPININVNITSSAGVKNVEFYINNKLKINDTRAPYEFRWAPIISGPYTLKAIIYDEMGKTASDEIKILKWRFHPLLILIPSVLLIVLLSQG